MVAKCHLFIEWKWNNNVNDIKWTCVAVALVWVVANIIWYHMVKRDYKWLNHIILLVQNTSDCTRSAIFVVKHHFQFSDVTEVGNDSSQKMVQI